jgi:hypothetical protein
MCEYVNVCDRYCLHLHALVLWSVPTLS